MRFDLNILYAVLNFELFTNCTFINLSWVTHVSHATLSYLVEITNGAPALFPLVNEFFVTLARLEESYQQPFFHL